MRDRAGPRRAANRHGGTTLYIRLPLVPVLLVLGMFLYWGTANGTISLRGMWDSARDIWQGPPSVPDIITERTVLIMVRTDRGITSGTGFVVADGMVVTNHHVIANARANGILVINESLGAVQQAYVMKSTGSQTSPGNDFALLTVDGMTLPPFTIYLPDTSMKLREVYAAGYPGDALATDRQFTALRAGAVDAVPALTVTEGMIRIEQGLGGANRVLVHTAPISRGNSGGPLLDTCGRVIGINTFVRQGALSNLNFALSSTDLMIFLRDTPAAPRVVTQACVPDIL